MVTGFVLISTEPGKEGSVYKAVCKYERVVDAHPLLGEYDIIAKVEAENWKTLGRTVVEDLRNISGVVSTITLAAIVLDAGKTTKKE